ncbi:MAG TPA: class I SAM-dependent methyltransferase, partial [Acidobacteriaceae bacterium]|nr:class I SAM-dependent methyltransferase [Acidobacteriaceae bacterium]
MPDTHSVAPDNTAVRTALWRALHVQADPPPHVFEDEVGLKLAAPDAGWRERPDMSRSRMRVFEIDQPGPQEWKRRRLMDLGLGIPPFLQLVPVDFE